MWLEAIRDAKSVHEAALSTLARSPDVVGDPEAVACTSLSKVDGPWSFPASAAETSAVPPAGQNPQYGSTKHRAPVDCSAVKQSLNPAAGPCQTQAPTGKTGMSNKLLPTWSGWHLDSIRSSRKCRSSKRSMPGSKVQAILKLHNLFSCTSKHLPAVTLGGRLHKTLDESQIPFLEAYRAPIWAPDGTSRHCMHCRSPFCLWRRRHHCRLCGEIFCSECANQV